MTSTLKLTRAQRQKLFAGEVPNISGKGKCPVEKGYILNLSTKVSLEVLRVIPTSNGWRLHYKLTDKRSPIRNLRRTPGIGREDFDAMRREFKRNGGYPEPLTPDVEEAAAQESAYTAIGAQVADAGEAVDEPTQRQLTEEAHRHFDSKRARKEREQARSARQLEQRLGDARYRARMAGIDVDTDERVIEDRIARMERKTRREAA